MYDQELMDKVQKINEHTRKLRRIKDSFIEIMRDNELTFADADTILDDLKKILETSASERFV